MTFPNMQGKQVLQFLFCPVPWIWFGLKPGHRHSASEWVLCYLSQVGVKRGERVLQLGFGTGFKVGP